MLSRARSSIPPNEQLAGLLSARDAAEWLGIGRTSLYKLISLGEIPTVKILDRRLVAVVDLEAYVARLRAGGAQ